MTEIYLSYVKQMLGALYIREAGSLKKSFMTLKAYLHLFRGHIQCLELT
jgi:hypothetical protein